MCLHKLYTSEEPLIREANQGASEEAAFCVYIKSDSERAPICAADGGVALLYTDFARASPLTSSDVRVNPPSLGCRSRVTEINQDDEDGD